MTLRERISKFVEVLIEKLNLLQQSIPNASYSNVEQLTGGNWINGKPIYRKVLSGSVTDKTKSMLISADVDEICLHSGTGDFSVGKALLAALPVYDTLVFNPEEGRIKLIQRFYGFDGPGAKPTNLVVSSYSKNTNVYLDAEFDPTAISHLDMNFRIIVEYTKVGGVVPDPDPDPEPTSNRWLDTRRWLDTLRWKE